MSGGFEAAGRDGFAGGTHIELEVAGDGDAVRPAADGSEAFGVEFALRENAVQTRENRTPEPAEAAIAREGAIGDAGVDDGDGDAAAETGGEQVGPEFGFGEDEQCGLKSGEISRDSPGQVERAIEDAIGAEAAPGEFLAGERGGGDEQAKAGQRTIEVFDESGDGK